tara:strand:- start:376 stop:1377 length:1002 start_codon:yes stop_codon:yes gene_type:complete
MPIEICICPKGRITGLSSNTPPSILEATFQAPGVPQVNFMDSFKTAYTQDHLLNNELGKFKTKPLHQRQTIAQVNAAVGPDMLLALSDFYDQQLDSLPKDFFAEQNKAMMGASIGAMGHHLSQLQNVIKEYQMALENVRNAYLSKMPKLEVLKFEQTARQLHSRLNTQFHNEISKRLASSRARKASIWNNADRGLNQAKSARTTKPIQISSAKELRSLSKFAGAAKFGGNALLLLDVHSRATGVRDTFESGGNWEKQALQETVGFSAGFAAGTVAAGSAYSIGVGIALAFTPVGWAVVIGVGAAASVGFLVGLGFDTAGKKITGKLYDASSNW